MVVQCDAAGLRLSACKAQPRAGIRVARGPRPARPLAG